MNYADILKFSDIPKYTQEKSKNNSYVKENKKFIRRLCELYLWIKLSRNDASVLIIWQINALGGEFQNIENSIGSILASIDNWTVPDVSTYWSYTGTWPRAKNFIDELILLQKGRLEYDSEAINASIESAISTQSSLQNTINAANEKITETAFNKIWGYFWRNSKDDRRLKEYYKKQYEKWMINIRYYLVGYMLLLIVIFFILLLSHSYPDCNKIFWSISKISFAEISSFIWMMSFTFGFIILILFLKTHFSWKNYYYHLFLEKENRNRLAIAWTYQLLSIQSTNISPNQQDLIIGELTKRLFEPLNTKSSDSILELPSWELIKSLRDAMK
jgi:hypothetical protein